MSDYTIPRDTAEARALADDCINQWQARDDRMRADQYLWELHQKETKKTEEPIAVNDNAQHLDKFAQEVARADLQVSVAPTAEADRGASQDVEDACYWMLDELQQRHVARLRSPFSYEVGFYTGLRGWVVASCLLNTDPQDAYPWDIRLLDPITVYPNTDDGTPTLVVHRYTTTYAALEAYWGEQACKRAFDDSVEGGRTGYEPATCYAFYTNCELGVLVDGGGWLKKPVAHEYGQLPIIIGVAPGAPYRAVEASESEHVEYVGPSLLRTLKGVVESKHKIAMILRRVLSKTAAPPLFAALSDPQATVDDVATEPNEVTIGRPGDSVNPIVPPPVALQHATALLSMLQDAENRGGMPPSLWGEGGGGTGVDRQKALGSGMSVLLARLEMLRYWYQAMLRLMLRQYAEHGVGAVAFLGVDRQSGIRTASGTLTPEGVQGVSARLECRFGRLQHVDLMQMGNLAALLTDRGLVSHEFALGELLGVDNPAAVQTQALRDQFYKDPMLLRMRVLFEKAQDPVDQIGAALAKKLLVSEWEKFNLAAAGQPNAAAGPGPGQPPLPGNGLPQGTLPALLGAGAGMPNGALPLGSPQAGGGLQLVPAPGGGPAGLPF